jgi:hypothetical protein
LPSSEEEVEDLSFTGEKRRQQQLRGRHRRTAEDGGRLKQGRLCQDPQAQDPQGQGHCGTCLINLLPRIARLASHRSTLPRIARPRIARPCLASLDLALLRSTYLARLTCYYFAHAFALLVPFTLPCFARAFTLLMLLLCPLILLVLA